MAIIMGEFNAEITDDKGMVKTTGQQRLGETNKTDKKDTNI